MHTTARWSLPAVEQWHWIHQTVRIPCLTEEDPSRKVPDLYFKVVDPKLQVVDLKAEVGDLRSPRFNPCLYCLHVLKPWQVVPQDQASAILITWWLFVPMFELKRIPKSLALYVFFVIWIGKTSNHFSGSWNEVFPDVSRNQLSRHELAVLPGHDHTSYWEICSQEESLRPIWSALAY